MTDGLQQTDVDHDLEMSVEAWCEYIDAAETARARVAARLEHDSSLSSAEFAVLHALAATVEGRLRSSRLAAAIRWEHSRLSHQLSRMEARSLIAREACTTDGRGTDVVLTVEGARRIRVAVPSYRQAVREAFGDALDDEQVKSVLQIARRLRTHLASVSREPESGPECGPGSSDAARSR